MAEAKKTLASTEELAIKNYEPEDYKSSSTLARGLAMTHEQASDAYAEGTIDGKLDDAEGTGDKDIPGGEPWRRSQY